MRYFDPYIKSRQVLVCPSDTGVPSFITADPFNQANPRPRNLAELEGSSYCFNVILRRLKSEAAVAQPADTYMGAEIWPWHSADAVVYWQNGTGNPSRIAYFADGHAKITSELAIRRQCVPFQEAPGIGPVP